MQHAAHQGQYVAWLEELFVTELVVTQGIFGQSPAEQQEWAQKVFTGPHEVTSYMSAWIYGKNLAWRRLGQMADDIRIAAEDSRQLWELRLTRLELRARTEVRDLQPTTAPSFHSFFSRAQKPVVGDLPLIAERRMMSGPRVRTPGAYWYYEFIGARPIMIEVVERAGAMCALLDVREVPLNTLGGTFVGPVDQDTE